MFKKHEPQSALDSLLSAAKRAVSQISIPTEAGKVLSAGFESLDHATQEVLMQASKDLEYGMEDFIKQGLGEIQAGKQTLGHIARREASMSAAFLAANVGNLKAVDDRRLAAGMEALADRPTGYYREGMEAYNNARRETMTAMSCAYNLNASQLSEFAELFLTPVTITPDQFGFSISAPLFELQEENRRQTNGQGQYNFGRKNLLKALIHPEILDNDITKIVPIVRPESLSLFVDPAICAPRDVELPSGEVQKTAPLKIGTEIQDIIGLAQTDLLLSQGILDQTDELDKAVQVSELVFSVNDGTNTDVFSFKGLEIVPSANFFDAQTGRTGMRQVLTMAATGFTVSPKTKQYDGSDLKALAAVNTGKYAVSVEVKAYGEVDREFGKLFVKEASLRVLKIMDQDGNDVSMKTGDGLAISNMLNAAKGEGWEPMARLTNTNRRQRGKMLNTSVRNFAYTTKLRSPFTVVRPQVQNGVSGSPTDAADLANLIFSTRVQADGAIVNALLAHADRLSTQVAVNGAHFQVDSEQYGGAGLMLTPFFERETLDFAQAMSYSNDADRIAAVQAVFQNHVQAAIYRAIRDSNWKAASMALNGGTVEMPEVRIGCDQILEQYLMKDGDFRTYGPRLNVRLASTQNAAMVGKVIITIAPPGSDMSSPLNPGFFLWSPELVTELPSVRGGAHSVELTVQPNWEAHVVTPVMIVFDIVNLEEVVTSRVPMLFENK